MIKSISLSTALEVGPRASSCIMVSTDLSWIYTHGIAKNRFSLSVPSLPSHSHRWVERRGDRDATEDEMELLRDAYLEMEGDIEDKL